MIKIVEVIVKTVTILPISFQLMTSFYRMSKFLKLMLNKILLKLKKPNLTITYLSMENNILLNPFKEKF